MKVLSIYFFISLGLLLFSLDVPLCSSHEHSPDNTSDLGDPGDADKVGVGSSDSGSLGSGAKKSKKRGSLPHSNQEKKVPAGPFGANSGSQDGNEGVSKNEIDSDMNRGGSDSGNSGDGDNYGDNSGDNGNYNGGDGGDDGGDGDGIYIPNIQYISENESKALFCCNILLELLELSIQVLANLVKIWTGSGKLLSEILCQVLISISLLERLNTRCKLHISRFDPTNRLATHVTPSISYPSHIVENAGDGIDYEVKSIAQMVTISRLSEEMLTEHENNEHKKELIKDLYIYDIYCLRFDLIGARHATISVLNAHSRVLTFESKKASLAVELFRIESESDSSHTSGLESDSHMEEVERLVSELSESSSTSSSTRRSRSRTRSRSRSKSKSRSRSRSKDKK
ncbi:hypothetical protein FG379_000436 [Cryptosporidium bovis]|uniref:uncharacterized protein n=1 Tax=Cryptosporidium bovis TaxID=310047 RepID=UPI00351A6ECD|nr:hypothetical protein FG379_000436 [Cryptosporidium bovis]